MPFVKLFFGIALMIQFYMSLFLLDQIPFLLLIVLMVYAVINDNANIRNSSHDNNVYYRMTDNADNSFYYL